MGGPRHDVADGGSAGAGTLTFPFQVQIQMFSNGFAPTCYFPADSCCLLTFVFYVILLSCKAIQKKKIVYLIFNARIRSKCSSQIYRSGALVESHHQSPTTKLTSTEKAHAVHHLPSQSTQPRSVGGKRYHDCENGSFTKYWSCCRFPGVAGLLNTHAESASLVILALCKEWAIEYGVTKVFKLTNANGSRQVHANYVNQRRTCWSRMLLSVSNTQAENLLVRKRYTFLQLPTQNGTSSERRKISTEDDGVRREQRKVGPNYLIAHRLPNYKNLFDKM